MTLLKTPIAYIRARPGLPVDVQRELAREAGCTVIYEHGEHKKRDMRAEWIRGLGVGRDQIAWVARLDVLLKPKGELAAGTRPTRDFAVALAAVAAKALKVVEGTTGASSAISADWQDRVSWAMHRATGGTTRDVEAQRAHGKRGGAITRSRSVVVKWRARPWSDKRRAAGVVWRDPECTDWQQARARLPDELQGLSFTSLWRLLGPRNPKRKRKAR